MADLPPEFKPDIEAALRLVIQAVSQMASQTAHGVPRNLQLAQNLLDPPVPSEDVPEPGPEPTQETPAWSSKKPAIDKPEPDTPTP